MRMHSRRLVLELFTLLVEPRCIWSLIKIAYDHIWKRMPGLWTETVIAMELIVLWDKPILTELFVKQVLKRKAKMGSNACLSALYCWLGQSLARQGRFPEALDTMKRAYDLAPTYPSYNWFTISVGIQVAELLYYMGDRIEVARIANELRAKFQNKEDLIFVDTALLSQIAFILMAAGNEEECATIIHRLECDVEEEDEMYEVVILRNIWKLRKQRDKGAARWLLAHERQLARWVGCNNSIAHPHVYLKLFRDAFELAKSIA